MGGLDDDRDRDAGVPHSGEHTQTVEIRHHEIEHDAIDRGTFRREQQGDGVLAAVAGDGAVACLFGHVRQQAALDGVIIDDQHALGHAELPNEARWHAPHSNEPSRIRAIQLPPMLPIGLNGL